MKNKASQPRFRGVLNRLRASEAGNTLVIMAAMMLPLLAFSGAAIDMARLYVVKVRLQQACDAGVLAGRKAMTDTSTSTALDDTAAQQAQNFFANNFRTGWYSTATPLFKPVKATAGSDSTVANAVTGTASVTVPMTIMGIFGVKTQTLSTSCQAIYDLADTDVMFVLDVTGSMSVTPSSGSEGGAASYVRADGITGVYRQEQSGSKIDGLRQAVILFDKTMTENKQTDTIVRYGFAPYSTVVNVGKLLPANSISSNLSYNSRQTDGDYDFVTGVTSAYPMTQAQCQTGKRYPSSGYANGFYYKAGSNNAVQITKYYAYVNFTGSPSWSSSGNTCTGTATIKRPYWKYGKVNLDVSSYLQGGYVATPGRIDGSTSKWRGCIELTDTTTATSFTSDNLPPDLDPDVLPNWRPMWPEAVWNVESNNDVKDDAVAMSTILGASVPRYSYQGVGYYENNDSVTCPMEAQVLTKMSATDVNDYVYGTNFKAAGNTYHDYGMNWGLRMLSTKGPFASSVAPTPGRKQPTQNIVFMTDGTPVADSDNYQMYGIEGIDGRLAKGSSSTEVKNHVARFRVLCDAAKARGITIYMIAFGTSLTSDMNYCASPGQAFYAKNSSDLQDAFAAIAKRIAMLRISK